MVGPASLTVVTDTVPSGCSSQTNPTGPAGPMVARASRPAEILTVGS